MRSGILKYRFISIVGAAAFCVCARVALAQTNISLVRSTQHVQPSDVAIPPPLGYVIETRPPTSPDAPTIVQIQDAHTQYEAQQNLANILNVLMQQYHLKLILVEGGVGDVGLDALRGRGTPERRRAVAEKYLRAGILSGEEYVGLISDAPLMLWGIEQRELYEQNLKAFEDSDSLKASSKAALAMMEHAIEQLRPQLSHPIFTELDAKTKACFAETTLGLSGYADYLLSLAARTHVPMTDYPNLVAFHTLSQLESAVQLDRVQEEQKALLEQLSQHVTPGELDALIGKAQAANTDAAKRGEFYTHLEALATNNGVVLDRYPNLVEYIRYLKASSQVQTTQLAGELDRVAAQIRRAVDATPEQRRFGDIADGVALLERLLDLQLSTEEYGRIRALIGEPDEAGETLVAWASFLNEQLEHFGFPPQVYPGLGAFGSALPRLTRFYETAQQRDAALVRNAIAKLRETKEPIAALITGGFHASQITRLLRDQGVGVLVVAPKVTHPSNERLYRAVLKYKLGTGSLEEVLSVSEAEPEQPVPLDTGQQQ